MPKIIQMKISLDGIEPKIWRRFAVEDSVSFEELHETIQKVMGWENYHLYEFKRRGKSIIPPEEGFNPAEASFHTLLKSPEFQRMLESQDLSKGSASLDVTRLNKILKEQKKDMKDELSIEMPINEFINKEGMSFKYTYDFGDNWDHSIVVEKIAEKDAFKDYLVCIEGERTCPPEDCGSVEGYKELMKIRKNKNHPKYEDIAFFEDKLEKEIMLGLSLTLQDESITHHELKLIFDYILWSIDNRSWMNDNQAFFY